MLFTRLLLAAAAAAAAAANYLQDQFTVFANVQFPIKSKSVIKYVVGVRRGKENSALFFVWRRRRIFGEFRNRFLQKCCYSLSAEIREGEAEAGNGKHETALFSVHTHTRTHSVSYVCMWKERNLRRHSLRR